jgi:hypothetical protein
MANCGGIADATRGMLIGMLNRMATKKPGEPGF